jgi:ADP-ribose pyrophosphatase YjhB (NUDIX family)
MKKNRHREDSIREIAGIPRWLEWARELQALAQTGFHYSENDYQRERFHRLTEIAAEIIAEQSGQPYPLIVDTFSRQAGYATPRVDVRGAVFRNGELLLVREIQDGGWTMPGGWADVGDIPSQAAEREVLEEAGFRVKARKVIGVYDANRTGPLEIFHAFKIVFLCDILEGEPRPSNETSEVAFFSRQTIPIVLSGERTKRHHILDAFHALDHPDMCYGLRLIPFFIRMPTHFTELPLELPGRVYCSAMPFGLYDREGEIYPGYLQANIAAVVVLAETGEIMEKSGRDLIALYRQQGMDTLHLPIRDFDIPDPELLKQATHEALYMVRQGKNIAIHCSAGLGRTGMFAACMAKQVQNLSGEQAIDWVRKYVPGAVETGAQRQFVIDF